MDGCVSHRVTPNPQSTLNGHDVGSGLGIGGGGWFMYVDVR